MKVKEIVIKKEAKFSHNYNTVTSAVVVTAEVEEGEDIQEIHKKLSEQVSEMLNEDLIEQLKLIK